MGAIVEVDNIKPLSAVEKSRRVELEAVITENFQAFCAVGQALAEIHNSQLYRTTHGDFAEYCRDLWDVSRSRAYQLIDAAQVVENIKMIKGIEIMPVNESQVRPLTKLGMGQQIEAWKAVVEYVEDERNVEGIKITAKLVKAKAAEISGEPVKKAIRNAKAQVTTSATIPPEFESAFDAFLAEIERAKDENWSRVPKQIVLNHLEALIAAIEE